MELWARALSNVSCQRKRTGSWGKHFWLRERRGQAPMHNRNAEAPAAVLRRAPVLPVLTVRSLEDAASQARALIAGGLFALEITLRTEAALGAIAALAKTFPGALVGAGTIIEPQQIKDAVEAGARFLVSPGMSTRLRLQAISHSPMLLASAGHGWSRPKLSPRKTLRKSSALRARLAGCAAGFEARPWTSAKKASAGQSSKPALP